MRYSFIGLFGLVLLFMGCKDEKIEAPNPPPVMLEHTKLTYSSRALSLIGGYGNVLKKRFSEQHGDLSPESYQIPSEYPFNEIVDHYAAELGKTGTWTEVDASKLEWSAEMQAAGWSNKKNLFLIYSLRPLGEADSMVPVNILSNVE